MLTTRKADLSGAMVASWVSQASFNPPGITVAVAKDRAVEALLHKGDRFALNVLAEGRETALMKQFLQPFEPGADRFAGLELDTSPAAIHFGIDQPVVAAFHPLAHLAVQPGQSIRQQGLFGGAGVQL